MIWNRSVPSNTVFPHVVYRNLADAIAWLTKTFGFTEHFRYGNPAEPSGAQLHLGNAWIMVRSARDGEQPPAQLGYGTQSLTVFVEEIEAHYRHTKSAGAKLVEELHETEYGEFQYAAIDLEGHHWLFSKHVRDMSPDEWGAKVSPGTHARVSLRPRPSVCYLQIPAVDSQQSADFYEKIFAWNIRHRNSSHPSFDDAAGDVSGGFFTGRAIAREPGIIVSVWVDNIEATLAKVAAHGGTVLESPHPDQPGSTSQIANFRDPAGNVIGLYQEAMV
jgi:uncharacterized glyoxalase superfamily protein PhnB/predicted enzyme related to lactoylglutathione lyase